MAPGKQRAKTLGLHHSRTRPSIGRRRMSCHVMVQTMGMGEGRTRVGEGTRAGGEWDRQSSAPLYPENSLHTLENPYFGTWAPPSPSETSGHFLVPVGCSSSYLAPLLQWVLESSGLGCSRVLILVICHTVILGYHNLKIFQPP